MKSTAGTAQDAGEIGPMNTRCDKTRERSGRWRRCRARPRCAAVLLAVLVCLVVMGTVMLAILRSAASEQRQLRGRQQQMQAERLAEAALERALAQVRAAAEYSGETWRVPAEEMGGRFAGVASIRVEPIAERRHERRVVVSADYPDDNVYRTRTTREAVITIDNRP